MPTHTQPSAGASWHGWAGLGWAGSTAAPTGLHHSPSHIEGFKVVDKYRFNLDFKNFFSLIYDLTL